MDPAFQVFLEQWKAGEAERAEERRRHPPEEPLSLVAFAVEAIDWAKVKGPGLAVYQADILRALETSNVAVYSGQGFGKKAVAAIAVLGMAYHHELRQEEFKIALVDQWRSLEFNLLPEVLTWAKLIRPEFQRGEMLRMGIRYRYGEVFCSPVKDDPLYNCLFTDHATYVFTGADNPANDQSLEAILYWSNEEIAPPRVLAVGLPPAQAEGSWHTLLAKPPARWEACRITVEEAIAAGRVRPQWLHESEERWGATSRVFRCRVLGELP